MALASKGGWVRRAATSSASTRPAAALTATVSAGMSGRATTILARASATDSISGRVVRAGLAARLVQQADIGDLHAAVDGLCHIVDSKCGDAGRRQRLHLAPGLSGQPAGRSEARRGGKAGGSQVRFRWAPYSH